MALPSSLARRVFSPRAGRLLHTTAQTRFPQAATPVAGEEDRPRWSHTPDRLKAPFKINVAKVATREQWTVNDDPAVLNAMYERLLGPGGANVLEEEVKWLAVTHRSFDGGRRGFNDRLAYFGRMSMVAESALDIVSSPPRPASGRPASVEGSEPFVDDRLARLDNLNDKQPLDVCSKERLERLAEEVGLPAVLRWKPRDPENLRVSGVQVVVNGALFAIVGAISLQRGAKAASEIIRTRIIERLR